MIFQEIRGILCFKVTWSIREIACVMKKEERIFDGIQKIQPEET